jgi:hypothetical protein
LSDSYYIRLGLTVRGPYGRSDLHELAARGGFSKAHDVSLDKKNWSSAAGFPDLFPQARRPGSDKSSVPGESDRVVGDAAETRETSPPDGAHQRADQVDRPAAAGVVPQTPSSSGVARKISPLTIWAVVTGPLGFTLLLLCTILVVLTLRTSKFAPSQNIGLMILLPITFLLGIAALTLGHLSIRNFRRQPGTLKERNLIVVGLSCGYTLLILTLMYSLVLLVSSLT